MAKKDAGSTPPQSNSFTTREGFLDAALLGVRPMFEALGYILADKIRMGVGFTGAGRFSNVRGEAWRSSESTGGVVELFFKPDVDDELEILTMLVSLLVMSLPQESPTLGLEYRTIAAEVGLRGTRKDPQCTPVLRNQLLALAQTLGPYPHQTLNVGSRAIGGTKPQIGRMLGASCPQCGARIRLTRSTSVSPGMPICSKDKVAFKLEEKGGSSPELTANNVNEQAPAGSAFPSIVNEAEQSYPGAMEPDASAREPLVWTASFPQRPASEVTKRLKELGGRYDGDRKCWTGTGDVTDVQTVVVAAGGDLTIGGDDNAPAA